jgi:hypothetical protein
MEQDDQRGDDPTKTWKGVPPSQRLPKDIHPAHEGRRIGPDEADDQPDLKPKRVFYDRPV